MRRTKINKITMQSNIELISLYNEDLSNTKIIIVIDQELSLRSIGFTLGGYNP